LNVVSFCLAFGNGSLLLLPLLPSPPSVASFFQWLLRSG
jgi:hypothetical protein